MDRRQTCLCGSIAEVPRHRLDSRHRCHSERHLFHSGRPDIADKDRGFRVRDRHLCRHLLHSARFQCQVCLNVIRPCISIDMGNGGSSIGTFCAIVSECPKDRPDIVLRLKDREGHRLPFQRRFWSPDYLVALRDRRIRLTGGSRTPGDDNGQRRDEIYQFSCHNQDSDKVHPDSGSAHCKG